MGSVTEFVECARCGSEDCVLDLRVNTMEEFETCPDCGYRRINGFKRDDNGNLILKDAGGRAVPSNLIEHKVWDKEPYGAWNVKYVDGRRAWGTLATVDDKDLFISTSSVMNSMGIIATLGVSRFIDGKIVREVLIDNEMIAN